jgi:hypothetical protein
VEVLLELHVRAAQTESNHRAEQRIVCEPHHRLDAAEDHGLDLNSFHGESLCARETL